MTKKGYKTIELDLDDSLLEAAINEGIFHVELENGKIKNLISTDKFVKVVEEYGTKILNEMKQVKQVKKRKKKKVKNKL